MPDILYNHQTYIDAYNSLDEPTIYDKFESGSLRVTELITDGNIQFGVPMANKFEATLFEDVDISQEDIRVFQTVDGTDIPIFTGRIDSAKLDKSGVYKDIIAYDNFYSYSTVNVSEWWESFWVNKEQSTLKELRTSLVEYMGMTEPNVTLLNDTMRCVKSVGISNIAFKDMFKYILELSAVFPNLDREGNLEYIVLGNNTTDITEQYETNSSEFQAYTTANITGIHFTDSTGASKRLVGNDTNPYTIASNILTFELSSAELDAVGNNLLNAVRNITYVPSNINMIVSNLDYKLGDKLHTEQGDTYILNNEYHGVQLVEQAIKSSGDELLPQVTDSANPNLQIIGEKIVRVQVDVEGLTTEFIDFEQQTESRFEQTSESIKSMVARNDESWDERGYIIYWKGYGLNNPIIVASGESRQPQVGDYYLDINTGRLCTIASLNKRESEESDAILTESGDEILTESGEVIILESDNVYDFAVDYQYIQLEREKVYVESQIEQLPHTISFKINGVKDGSGELGRNANVGITLSVLDADGNIVDTGTGTITLNGNVIFTNDLSDGTTVISGNNIKTGTVSADRLDVTGIFAENVTATGTISGATITGASGEFTESFSVLTDIGNDTYLWMDTMGSGYWLMASYGNGSESSITMSAESMLMNTPAFYVVSSTNMQFNIGVNKVIEINNSVVDVEDNIRVFSSDGLIKTLLSRSGGIELAHSSNIPYIDFHNSDNIFSEDFSVRQILINATTLQFRTLSGGATLQAGAYNNYSSKAVKENIEPMQEEEAKKLLDVDICSFDFIDGWGEKNQYGVIAEEVNEIMPYVATIPDDWDADSFDKENKNTSIPSVDYAKFTPYMIKLLQMQNKEIETMKDEIATLKEQVAFLLDKMKGE